jgi:hypothetical protein
MNPRYYSEIATTNQVTYLNRHISFSEFNKGGSSSSINGTVYISSQNTSNIQKSDSYKEFIAGESRYLDLFNFFQMFYKKNEMTLVLRFLKTTPLITLIVLN